jgi:hypothetical protein
VPDETARAPLFMPPLIFVAALPKGDIPLFFVSGACFAALPKEGLLFDLAPAAFAPDANGDLPGFVSELLPKGDALFGLVPIAVARDEPEAPLPVFPTLGFVAPEVPAFENGDSPVFVAVAAEDPGVLENGDALFPPDFVDAPEDAGVLENGDALVPPGFAMEAPEDADAPKGEEFCCVEEDVEDPNGDEFCGVEEDADDPNGDEFCGVEEDPDDPNGDDVCGVEEDADVPKGEEPEVPPGFVLAAAPGLLVNGELLPPGFAPPAAPGVLENGDVPLFAPGFVP